MMLGTMSAPMVWIIAMDQDSSSKWKLGFSIACDISRNSMPYLVLNSDMTCFNPDTPT
jgi:hypothetical protein